MSYDTSPRRSKKSAYIVRADVSGNAPHDTEETMFGEAWAAIEADGSLISVSTDITVVSKAAFRSGFWVENQE